MTTAFDQLKSLGRKTFPRLYNRWVRWQRVRERPALLEKIKATLASSKPPQYCDDDKVFEKLQDSYEQWWPDYKYDRYSTWQRGNERAAQLLNDLPHLQVPGLDVLDGGCGDGMTGYAFANFGHCVTLSDIEDWRDSRSAGLRFVKGDFCKRLSLADESFDLLLSFNTFEHMENPKAALAELTRLCKVGGHILIDFGPLYCSSLGLHAFSLRIPYPQFLFSPDFIARKLRAFPVPDLGRVSSELQWTNQWRAEQFSEIWRESGCDIVWLRKRRTDSHLNIVLDYPRGFSGRKLTVEDLVLDGICVLLRKRPRSNDEATAST